MNKVVLYNVIGMLIVTQMTNITVAHPCICVCVFYTKQRKIKISDGKKSIAKENYCVSTLPNVFFYVIYMFNYFMFFFK